MKTRAVGWENIKKDKLFLPPSQSPLGTWPVCCYVQRALVSAVRSHMAMCPFGHSGLCVSQASGGRCGPGGGLVIPPQLSFLSRSGVHNFPPTLKWDSKPHYSSGLINLPFFVP